MRFASARACRSIAGNSACAPLMNVLAHRRFDQSHQRFAIAQFAFGSLMQLNLDPQGRRAACLHDGIALQLRLLKVWR